MLRFQRKQQNYVKQLPFSIYIYIYVIIIKELLTVFNSGCISFLIFMYSSGSESHSVGSSSLQPHKLYSPWNSPGQNTGVNNLFLLHGIIPTQGSKPGLQHCRHIFYRLSHKGSPVFHVCCCCCYVASVVSDSVRPDKAGACQAPTSLGFSRQEH